MSHHPQQGSPVAVFLTIYLLISLAVGGAIFLLVKGQSVGEPVDVVDSTETYTPPATTTEAPKAKPEPKPKAQDTVASTPIEAPEKPVETAPEPEPRQTVTTEPEPETRLSPEEIAEIEALYPFPEIKPLMEIVDNWQNVPERAYPKLVAIKKSVEFQVIQNGQVVANGSMPSGAMMVPARLNGDQITLTAGNTVPITVTIPVEDTDFKELIELRYNAFIEDSRAGILARREAEMNRRLGAIAKEESMTDWNDGSDPRFEPAKVSLQKGEVGNYTIYDATKWRWAGTEKDGDTEYEVAFVLMVSEAAFGVTERELKVYMNEGKAVKWVDPTTNEAI